MFKLIVTRMSTFFCSIAHYA